MPPEDLVDPRTATDRDERRGIEGVSREPRAVHRLDRRRVRGARDPQAPAANHITVTFNEPIDPAAVNAAAAIRVFDRAGHTAPATFQMVAGSNNRSMDIRFAPFAVT